MPTLGVDDEDALDAATAALRAGELVVLPTDTVYGLAALAGHAGAAQRIFGAKGRPDRLPLPVLASSLDQVRQLGVEIPAAAAALAAQWWPGPLTMAFGFSASATHCGWTTRSSTSTIISGGPRCRAARAPFRRRRWCRE